MTVAAGGGVGASVRRKEDERFLRGRGQFVGDIHRAGLLEVAFVRSSVAHGRIAAIRSPSGDAVQVWTMSDMHDVRPIRAVSALRGFKASDLWPLARGKVRHVGEPIAMCVAATRAQAEDLAARVEVDYEELPAVTDMIAARVSPSALVHDEWGDNVFLETLVDDDLDAIRGVAAVRVRRHLRTARQSMAPLEGRAVLCEWIERLEQLEVYSAAQMPHITRAGLAECLGMEQGAIRVIAPDVGGGFGYKGILLQEEVCLGWLARHLRCPVRWLEDRREQLAANANCREHDYDITLYADRDGRLLAIDCEATVDSGAYSLYPFSACLEAAQVGSILPGPYKMDRYRCRTFSVATNKPGILPYRGVARTGVCFALEVTLDALARELGKEAHEVRLKNLVAPSEMPFDNITNKHFDSGDYPQAVKRAIDALGLSKWCARQASREADGRLIGIGTAIYCEQAAHGTSVYHGWGIPMVPGREHCHARLTPDGGLELRIGAHSHGQGLETTLAQVAHEVLGIDSRAVRLIHGDTALTPYSTGTWGSRSMVMSGGAVAQSCRTLAARVLAIAAHSLATPVDNLQLRDGAAHVIGSDRAMTLAEVAYEFYRAPQRLPDDLDPQGLEAVGGYKARVDTGTFSYACHAVAVAVDAELGRVELLDYVIVEDGGTLINPMIVDGQIHGGAAQGIGTALYEEMPYDEAGQPLATTLADYLLPGATEVPAIRIEHMANPSPYTEFGQKGIGEGGAIAPPAAIVNAVNDALKPLGAEITELPATPRRIIEAIRAARGGTRP